MSPQQLKHSTNMVEVVFSSLAKDQNVIQIYNHRMPQHMVNKIIDESHKCGRGISEAKRHHHPLTNPKVSFESSLPGISSIHANLMIASREIHFSEILGSM